MLLLLLLLLLRLLLLRLLCTCQLSQPNTYVAPPCNPGPWSRFKQETHTWMQPTTPGRIPSTPPSAHDGTKPGGGGVGSRSRYVGPSFATATAAAETATPREAAWLRQTGQVGWGCLCAVLGASQIASSVPLTSLEPFARGLRSTEKQAPPTASSDCTHARMHTRAC